MLKWEYDFFVSRQHLVNRLLCTVSTTETIGSLLLIYGRRRTGKTTFVTTLNQFVLDEMRIAKISMQNPRAFTSLPSLTGLLAETAQAAAGVETAAAAGTLEALFRALDEVNARLAPDRRLLLACDEFEMIDAKIGEGVLPLDLLHMLRESIQTHRRITWAFVGSHDLGELRHADWSSFFVSLRTLEVTPFTPEETRLLLTEPLKSSPLWNARTEKAPRFDPAFWGEGGIERIQAETGGWPHLVQLVAETAVDLANDKGVAALDAALLEQAFAASVGRGDAVLHQLVESESRLPGEMEYLLGFRGREVQPEPQDDALRRSLRRRLLVEAAAPGTWRMRVPLMRRWLIERG